MSSNIQDPIKTRKDEDSMSIDSRKENKPNTNRSTSYADSIQREKEDRKIYRLGVPQSEVDMIKFYLKHKCYPFELKLKRERKSTLKKYECFFLKDEQLYYKGQESSLLVVAQEEKEKIKQIIMECHGEKHLPPNGTLNAVRSMYFGITLPMVSSWLRMCLECKRVINEPYKEKFVKKYAESVSVVRDPWFALSFYTIELFRVFPGVPGVLLVIQDIYSKYIFHKALLSPDSFQITAFFENLIKTFGAPEIIKILDHSLISTDLLDLCRKNSVQVIDQEDMLPIDSETLKQPKYLEKALISDLKASPMKSFYDSIDKTIEIYNFTDHARGGRLHRTGRIAANIFFRRPVRIQSKEFSKNYWRRYNIVRNDLPSFIDYLSEQDTQFYLQVKEEQKLMQESLLKKNSLTPDEQLKTDKEIEEEERGDKEKIESATLYSKTDPKFAYTNFPESEPIPIPIKLNKMGSLVFIAKESSLYELEGHPKIKKKSEPLTLPLEIEEKIENICMDELNSREIRPEELALEEDPFWVVRPVKDTQKYLLYNTNKKTFEEIDRRRIFKASQQINQKSRHLITFLFKKFKDSVVLPGN
ncbi:hypothetical protein NEFER03_1503 [Nematocida sp. LUAm3]|nr:hypothetical protein NEFER03_1503 [Nematocida sp. LUAm3]KAI5174536.1 hypothetical protein NEFER02_0657 [Nematocida sp. LUAm2]KAI5178058.1 hypothetical protein NEFER01_1240 [Nematocida sp. LUAm1]